MIGDQIKALRVNLRLSQADFSSKTGISQGYLSAVERNQKVPGSDVVITLKKLFQLNSDWLLTGEGEMYAKKEGNQEKEIDSEEESEIHSNTIKKQQKQPLNSHLTDADRMYQFPPDSITKALGKRMCVYGIQEGDIIILDDKNEPNESDLVLQIKNDVPTIEKFQPGDPKPYAICVRLQRNLKAPEKPRTDL